MTAIILHLYYQDLWEEFKNNISLLLNDDVHLYVTVTEHTPITDDIKNYAKEIFLVENKGMDFGPFIYAYNKIRHLNYKNILKIHSKKSVHNMNMGNVWRKKLTEVFFNSKDTFLDILNAMNDDDTIFMAGAYSCFYDKIKENRDSLAKIKNEQTINKVNSFLKLKNTHGCFFAGSIFMVSTKYLDMLFKNVNLDEFYLEFNHEYTNDVSLAHAMERMIGYGVENYNGKFLILE